MSEIDCHSISQMKIFNPVNGYDWVSKEIILMCHHSHYRMIIIKIEEHSLNDIDSFENVYQNLNKM